MPKQPRFDYQKAATLASHATGHVIEFVDAFATGALSAAKFRLANGLKIVLMPDFTAPVFAYQSWFKVGSKDEDQTRTGLAHLFEHLMFKGTKTHPAGEFDREMERRGSETNAATWLDWTHYTLALPAASDNFETVVHFEADRMVNLVLDEQTFRSELEVVKNERRMSVDDSVSGLIAERLYQEAFLQHAYRWPTIGYMEHLEACTVEELTAFYRRHYAPNNATIVVCGALEPGAALEVLARAYAPLSKKPMPRSTLVAEPPQIAARHAQLRLPLMAPQVAMGYHAVPQNHADYAALEVIGQVLFGGESARLYKRLVIDEELVSDLSGYVLPLAEPGLFEVNATLRQGVAPHEVVSLIQEGFDALAQGVDDTELEKACNGLELGYLESLCDMDGCAEALGHHETNFDNFAHAFTLADRYRRVTAGDVSRLAKRLFGKNQCTTVFAHPADEGFDAQD